MPTGVRPRFTDRFDELGIKLSPRVFGAGRARAELGVTPALLLVVGLAAVAAGLLLLALVVVPAGPSRVPLSRLDPTVAPESSALAGAGAAAGAAVEKVLVKRGRLAAGRRRSSGPA